MDRDEVPLKGYGEDGPVFEKLCPSCGRFMRFPQTIHWKESMDGMCDFEKIECSKCGPVEPRMVGWVGDFT